MDRLKALLGKLWRNTHLVCAGWFAFLALTADSWEVGIPTAGFAAFSLMLWETDRGSRQWRELTYKWKAAAQVTMAELQRRDAAAIQWADFCRAVQDNVPEDRREAVQYALDLAVASHLPVGKVH